MIASFTYILPFLAFCIAILVHFLMIRISFRKKLFLDSREKVQKAHKGIRPRIGGAGIFLAALLMLKEQPFGFYLLLPALPVFLAGVMEDYSGNIKPLIRLFFMIVGAVLFLTLMPTAMFTGWRHLSVASSVVMGCVFVLLLVVTNGINFIDGHNGLAAGSSLLSALSILWLSYCLEDRTVQCLSLIIIAAVLAFLLFNFPNGRLFLGDGGAYFLGFTVTTLGVLFMSRHQAAVSFLLLPVLLIYPLWEVIFSALRKIFWEHISPFKSDKYHLHQLVYRFYGKGHQSRPAIIMLPFQALVCVLAVACADRPDLLALLGLAFCVGYVWAYVYLRRLTASQ